MMDDVEAILVEYGPAMRRLVASYLPPGPEREDLEQDIYLAIYKGMKVFRGECSVRTYIYRIGHSCALRARLRYAQPAEPPEPPEPPPTPEHQLIEQQRHEQLARALRALPLPWRQPLTMRLSGLSYQEIAEILDLDLHNVNMRIHRGTRALRQLLQEER
jgi:RNA polymerase sigma factor (sigma-70 family)